jgi:RNA polymerase sigma-70 factor (family 1)
MRQKEEAFYKELSERNTGAYKILYDQYYKSLVVYALKFVPHSDVAGDIVQELFVSIWEKKIAFATPIAFKSYLYASVKNACLNHLNHKEVEDRYAASVLSGPTIAISDTELEEEEIYRQLFLAIEKLPPRCRGIFEKHLEGKKNSEIAEYYQISLETVKTQKKRAVKFLREQLTSSAFLLLLSDFM